MEIESTCDVCRNVGRIYHEVLSGSAGVNLFLPTFLDRADLEALANTCLLCRVVDEDLQSSEKRYNTKVNGPVKLVLHKDNGRVKLRYRYQWNGISRYDDMCRLTILVKGRKVLRRSDLDTNTRQKLGTNPTRTCISSRELHESKSG